MTIGTKSILLGAHCFFLHPWFVARAWTRLFGFPWDPRYWVAFFVHDLGYFGKTNIDGPEGERHVELGARIMHRLFDKKTCSVCPQAFGYVCPSEGCETRIWYDFCLYHSRYYAKKHGAPPSRLCFADKLAFALTPHWLYLPMVTATGEIHEYLQNAQRVDSVHWEPPGFDKKRWHAQLSKYMRDWVWAHVGGDADTWTPSHCHAPAAEEKT